MVKHGKTLGCSNIYGSTIYPLLEKIYVITNLNLLYGRIFLIFPVLYGEDTMAYITIDSLSIQTFIIYLRKRMLKVLKYSVSDFPVSIIDICFHGEIRKQETKKR